VSLHREMVVQVAEDNTRIMPKEMYSKNNYRESNSKSKRWNCFSSAPKLDGTVYNSTLIPIVTTY